MGAKGTAHLQIGVRLLTVRIDHLSVDSHGPARYATSNEGEATFSGTVIVHLETDSPELLADLQRFIDPVVIKWASLKASGEKTSLPPTPP